MKKKNVVKILSRIKENGAYNYIANIYNKNHNLLSKFTIKDGFDFTNKNYIIIYKNGDKNGDKTIKIYIPINEVGCIIVDCKLKSEEK